MTKRQRLDTVFAGGAPDRTPVLGGWIASRDLILGVTGKTSEDYRENAEEVTLEAYRLLGMDGLIGLFTTQSEDGYRTTNRDNYLKADTGMSFEECVRKVEELPSASETEKNFDFDKAVSDFRASLTGFQQKCGDMVYMPAQWGAGAKASWYGEYGYENFFLLYGLRPDLGIKLFEVGGAYGRFRSRVIAEMVREGLFPKALLFGEDICTQRGPMISTKFLKEHYAPALAYGLEPLLEVGCKPVWHSDGDVRPLLPMLIDCGVQGFQGFQPECGMTIDFMSKQRTKDGGKILIFGPFSVTTELPVLTPDEIRGLVRRVKEICEDEADLVFFTSNTIIPDTPLENLLALYDEISNS
ncbi:MAG: hypothetical protein FWF03_02815 [Defluviitaleaceae bacterium]|nr:hypothetical protein [Defluviitaleaceae bacterium]